MNISGRFAAEFIARGVAIATVGLALCAAALSIACGRVMAKDCIFWRDIHGWTASNGAGTEIAVGSSGYLQLSHSILPDLAVTNVSYAAASCGDGL